MEIKNMAYWRAKNNNSPLKQKQVEVREDEQYKNPKGQSQADIINKRNKATTDYVTKVEAHAKNVGGLNEKEHAKAQKKLNALMKATGTSMDSIAGVNKQMDIKIAKKRKESAGDLFD